MHLQKSINGGLYIKDCRWLSKLNNSELGETSSLAVAEKNGQYCLSAGGTLCENDCEGAFPVKYLLPCITSAQLGDASFKKDYGIQYAYYAGAMANAISSVEMVIALGKAGFMCSYGSGGISLSELETAIDKINRELSGKSYLINFLNSYNSPAEEMKFVQLCIKKRVPGIEASAFINLPPALLYYKLSGLVRLPGGRIHSTRKIIAKVSREEVAAHFMSPPDPAIVKILYKEGLITREQAEMAAQTAVADDITVEADSGGHTDNRPLVSLFPAITSLRDEMQVKYGYKNKIRIGAAGGISTPQSALAAFQMGAAYVVTGSVNQSCVEAGTSDYVKQTLAKVTMGDVVMAPCADMFEMGTKVQVIKKGTMYPMIAQKLYDLYIKNKSIEDLTETDKKRIEKSYFKCSIDEVWTEVCRYFDKVDKRQISLAEKNGKIKMALIFRWYLGKSSKWAIEGLPERQMDMQIWCGQSMGAFNNWCKGTYMEQPDKRYAADIAKHIMDGAAYLQFKKMAEIAGVSEDLL